VAGTTDVGGAARRAGPGRVGRASAGGALRGGGDWRDPPLDESAEVLPDAPYGQAKYAAEGDLSVYNRLYDLSTVSLRLGNVYGPRQDQFGEAGGVANFCGALLQGRRPRGFGDRHQHRDYHYVCHLPAAKPAAARGVRLGR